MYDTYSSNYTYKNYHRKKYANNYYSKISSTKQRSNTKNSMKYDTENYSQKETTISSSTSEIKSSKKEIEKFKAEVSEFSIEVECKNDENKENISSLANNSNLLNTKISIIPNKMVTPQKQNTNFEIQKKEIYGNLSPQKKENIPTSSSSTSSSMINLQNDNLKDAYFFPKRLTTAYNMMYSQYQYQLINSAQQQQMNQNHCQNVYMQQNQNTQQMYQNNFNNLMIRKCYSNSLSNHTNNQNAFINMNNNANCCNLGSNNPNITPFTYYDPPQKNISPFNSRKSSFNSTSSNNNSSYNGNNNGLNLNKIKIPNGTNACNNSYDSQESKEKENTDILCINVKISQSETLVFKIRRYDDMFKTVKIFCEINQLNPNLIRPIILYIIKALNSIYGIVNMKLSQKDINFLGELKNLFN